MASGFGMTDNQNDYQSRNTMDQERRTATRTVVSVQFRAHTMEIDHQGDWLACIDCHTRS